MVAGESISEKVRRITAVLPKENCGKCGYPNCGRFALAAANGEVSPFGCRKNPSAGYEISRILGIENTAPQTALPASSVPVGALSGHRHGGKGHHSEHHSGHISHRHGSKQHGLKGLSAILGHHSKRKHH